MATPLTDYTPEPTPDPTYADVIGALQTAVTEQTFMDQTGGGCEAIRIWLGADWYALVTADDDPLPSDRPHGWCVGVYSGRDEHGHHRAGCEGWIVYESKNPDVATMVAEVAPLLKRLLLAA